MQCSGSFNQIPRVQAKLGNNLLDPRRVLLEKLNAFLIPNTVL